MELSAGTVVAERFRLVRQLGEGGMGAVWLAHHVKLDTPCAVKFIHAEVATAAGVAERFEREAKIAAQLRSPHVVHVLDYGVYDGVPYIGMEYLDGEDLSHRLAARGRLGPEETVAIVAQIARALTKAHAAGLVHRDLKPENVFLVRDDDAELVKVLDFGIAKAQVPMVEAKTRTGTLLGTPRFMSPEQAQGSKTLDHRSDLWSLGVIAYRCVVGALPFDSDALGDLLMQIIVRPLPVPSQVAAGLPPSFDAFWRRAAAREPAERFQTAKELAEALAASFGLAAATSGPVGIGGPTPLSIPKTAFDPGISTRPSSSSGSFPPSPGMGNDATMLPGGQPPSHSSGMLAAHALSAPPEQTMSPASRTFAGAPAPKRTSPVLLLAIGMIVGVAAVVGVALVALHGKTGAGEPPHGAEATAASAPVVATAAPSVEPAAATASAADEAPPAGASAPTPAASAPATPPPPPQLPPPQVVQHHRAPVQPPPPTRRGKVHIEPPAN